MIINATYRGLSLKGMHRIVNAFCTHALDKGYYTECLEVLLTVCLYEEKAKRHISM